LIFAVGLAWTGYYNKAVTGNPFLLPHVLYHRQYHIEPIFWFQAPDPEPIYPHPRIAALLGNNVWEAPLYRDLGAGWQRPWRGLLDSLWCLGLTLGVSVLMTLIVPVAWRDPIYRKMVIVTGIFAIALSATSFHNGHYAAPGWAVLSSPSSLLPSLFSCLTLLNRNERTAIAGRRLPGSTRRSGALI
jgi:hypothetical protein